MSPSFLVTCAIRTLSAEVDAWANVPRRRAHFEQLAALVLDGPVADFPKLASEAVAREIQGTFDKKGWDF